MNRSEDSWREISKTNNDYQLAKFVIDDLIGYRSSSAHKSDDIESLRNLIGILRDEG